MESEVSKHLQTFQHDGFCIINEVMPRDEVLSAGLCSTDVLGSYFERIELEGMHLGMGMKEGYAEIVQRSPKRYDIKVPGRGALAELVQAIEAEPRVANFLQAVLGLQYRLVHQDIVISLPGAKEQQWHTDGSHLSLSEHLPCHCLNLFVPLIDLTEHNGATELRPASHYLTRDLKKFWLVAYAKKQIRSPVTPLLKAGSILAFDYRLLHHGTANLSSEHRPILVLTFSKPWYVDIFNFPSRSIFKSNSQSQQNEILEQDTNHQA